MASVSRRASNDALSIGWSSIRQFPIGGNGLHEFGEQRRAGHDAAAQNVLIGSVIEPADRSESIQAGRPGMTGVAHVRAATGAGAAQRKAEGRRDANGVLFQANGSRRALHRRGAAAERFGAKLDAWHP